MILITGSGGFIGKSIKNYLLKEMYDVLTPRSYELNLLDKTEVRAFLKSNKVDTIIHCAANGVVSSHNMSEYNVAGDNLSMFKNIAESASENTLIINMGSGAEYDKSRELKKVREDQFGESIPSDHYGYSKYLISKEIEKYPNALNLRLFGVYGKGEHASRFPSYAIRMASEKKPIEINQNVFFSYLFAEDLCKIVGRFISDMPITGFFNVVPNDVIDLLNIAKKVNKLYGSDAPIIIKNEGFNTEYSGDNKLLASKIVDLKFTSLDDALHSIKLMS